MKRCVFFAAFLVFPFVVFSQEKSAFEIYGGPSKAFLPFEVIPSNSSIIPKNQIGYNGGIAYVHQFADSWQWTVQLEFFKRPLGTKRRYSFGGDSLNITGYSTDVIPLVALGVRKNWLGFKNSFFVQPSISVMKSPSFLNYYEGDGIDFLGYPLGVESKSDVGLGLRIEGGVKRYLPSGNYFSLGMRFQQGLILMDQMNAPVFTDNSVYHVVVAKSRGSYLGLYGSFGIVGDKFKKSSSRASKRVPDEHNLRKEQLAGENGMYFYLSGGTRLRENVLKNGYTYSNLSGQFQIGMGYYLNGFSLETGFGNFSYNNNYQLDYDGIYAMFKEFHHFDLGVIPLNFKYHYQLDNRNEWKVGPSVSANFVISNSGNRNFTTGPGTYGYISKTSRYEAQHSSQSLPTSNIGIFFNAGVYVEKRFLNSSFISFKLSRNFGSPDFSKIDAVFQIEGNEISMNPTGGLNGYLADLSVRLPLKVLDYTRKRDD